MILILLPFLFLFPSVGADGTGAFGEMSTWYELLVTFVVTWGGFLLAMQFDDIIEKRSIAEQEADMWYEIEKLITLLREKLFSSKISWLIIQCNSFVKMCEIDSISMLATRKSPFYRNLYLTMTYLNTLPIEKNDLLFDNLEGLHEKYSAKDTEKQKKDLIEVLYIWAARVLLIDSIDFNDYKLFQETNISSAINLELKSKFITARYIEKIQDGLKNNLNNSGELINILNKINNPKNSLTNNKIMSFCQFLVLSEEESKKSYRYKIDLIRSRIINKYD